jgi:hypothetical protein
MAAGKKTGGRTKGTPNKATAAKAEEIAASGETPLDYMLRVMRDPKELHPRRDDMAKACAPYVHPKLAAVTHAGDQDNPIQVEGSLSAHELPRRLAFILTQAAERAKKEAK